MFVALLFQGIILEAETYEAVIKTVKRDCRVTMIEDSA